MLAAHSQRNDNTGQSASRDLSLVHLELVHRIHDGQVVRNIDVRRDHEAECSDKKSLEQASLCVEPMRRRCPEILRQWHYCPSSPLKNRPIKIPRGREHDTSHATSSQAAIASFSTDRGNPCGLNAFNLALAAVPWLAGWALWMVVA